MGMGLSGGSMASDDFLSGSSQSRLHCACPQIVPAALQFFDQRRDSLNLTAPLGQHQQTQSTDNLQTERAGVDHGRPVIEQQASFNGQRSGNGAGLSWIETPTRPFKLVDAGYKPAFAHRLLDPLGIDEPWSRRTFSQYRGGHLNFCKQRGQQMQSIQPAKGDQRPGIGNDDPS